MRNELREFVHDIFGSDKFKSRGIDNYQSVLEIVNSVQMNKSDNSNKIFILLMLELWFRRFVNRRHEIASPQQS